MSDDHGRGADAASEDLLLDGRPNGTGSKVLSATATLLPREIVGGMSPKHFA